MFFLPTPGNRDWPFPIPRTKKARNLIDCRPRRLQKYTDKGKWDLVASGEKQGTREKGETEISKGKKKRCRWRGKRRARGCFWGDILEAGWRVCSLLEWAMRRYAWCCVGQNGRSILLQHQLLWTTIIPKVLSKGLHRIWRWVYLPLGQRLKWHPK